MKRLILRLWDRFKALPIRAKVLIAVVLAALLGVVVWLVFFWFAFQTYFIDDEVDEAGPVFDSGAVSGTPVVEEDPTPAADTPAAAPEPDVSTPAADTPATAPEPDVSTPAADTPAAAPEPDAPTPAADTSAAAPEAESPPVGTMPGDEISEELQAEMDEAMAEEGMAEVVEVQEEMPEMPQQPQVRVEARGDFISRSHPTRGSAEVLGDGTGQRFLRFEDFRTDNGPDLNVYLSSAPTDAPAGQFDDDFVDLGDLKGNVGSQNYEIPRDLDLDLYSTVVIWCVRFSVVFGAAELVPS